MSAAALLKQGLELKALKRFDEAVACFEQAVRLRPEDAEAWYQLGLTLSLLGRLDEARESCLKTVSLDPTHAEAYNNIGYTLFSAGRWEEAQGYFARAAAINPGYARAHFNRGLCLRNLQREDEAAASFEAAAAAEPDFIEAYYQRAQAYAALQRWQEAAAALKEVVKRQSDHVEAWYRLGKIHALQQEYQEAADCFRHVIVLRPDYAPAHLDLGLVMLDLGDPGQALAHYRAALELTPRDADVQYQYAQACMRVGKASEALAGFSAALALRPDFAAACVGLGNALLYLSRREEAIEQFRRALELKADPAPVYANLGIAYQNLGRTDEALRLYMKAIELDPANAELYHNLGTIWSSVGATDRASRCFEQAVQLRPDFAAAYDSALLCRLYTGEPEPAATSVRGYALRFEAPLRDAWPRHRRARAASRRLKVGYVSPDLRRHSVGYFIEPLLAQHDRDRIEVCCYYNHGTHDDVTERVMRHSDHWLDCLGLPDADLAARIHADEIDVLVDLAGHTAGNRLLVFARKPAPVQVSYLGYPATTGLQAMDWRLVTAATDPAGSEAWHSERLYRLPRSLWCYRPPATAGEVQGETPARTVGAITFGSMNNIAKVSDAAIATWSGILKRVPGARLVMTGLADGAQRRMREQFTEHGIEAERLRLHGRLGMEEFHRVLGTIDLALDTFPYAGTTTTCEALWLGVPVLTLSGETSVSRSGHALLKMLGLDELIAPNEAEYVQKAIELAHDLDRLDALRRGMRSRFDASPLRDEAGFTRELEDAYRVMWADWCDRAEG
jgi:predicted O-linked N-acetylglucosamine transferase (SPINDLY family)